LRRVWCGVHAGPTHQPLREADTMTNTTTTVPNIGTLLVCSDCGGGNYFPRNGIAQCVECWHEIDPAVDVVTDEGERVVWVGGRLAVISI